MHVFCDLNVPCLVDWVPKITVLYHKYQQLFMALCCDPLEQLLACVWYGSRFTEKQKRFSFSQEMVLSRIRITL
jgi:hypothetical protein